jgi:hypothetical protein
MMRVQSTRIRIIHSALIKELEKKLPEGPNK